MIFYDWFLLIGCVVILLVFFVLPFLSLVFFILCQYWTHYPNGHKRRKK